MSGREKGEEREGNGKRKRMKGGGREVEREKERKEEHRERKREEKREKKKEIEYDIFSP